MVLFYFCGSLSNLKDLTSRISPKVTDTKFSNRLHATAEAYLFLNYIGTRAL